MKTEENSERGTTNNRKNRNIENHTHTDVMWGSTREEEEPGRTGKKEDMLHHSDVHIIKTACFLCKNKLHFQVLQWASHAQPFPQK